MWDPFTAPTKTMDALRLLEPHELLGALFIKHGYHNTQRCPGTMRFYWGRDYDLRPSNHIDLEIAPRVDYAQLHTTIERDIPPFPTPDETICYVPTKGSSYQSPALLVASHGLSSGTRQLVSSSGGGWRQCICHQIGCELLLHRGAYR